MKNNLVVDVYSSPTLDLVKGSLRVGGPGYYIAMALKTANVEAELRLIGCGGKGQVFNTYRRLFKHLTLLDGPVIVFEIDETGERRKLGLRAHCGKAQSYTLAGDIAVVSPVYWDISAHVPPKISTSYRTVVFDVQGYTRLGEDSVERSARLLPATVQEARRNVVVRGSVDDIVFPSELDHVSELIHVLTAGGRAIIVLEDSHLTLIKPQNLLNDVDTIGAGDAYDIYLALALYEGYTLTEAAIAAHNATEKYLRGVGFVFDVDMLLREAERSVKLYTASAKSLSSALTLAYTTML